MDLIGDFVQPDRASEWVGYPLALLLVLLTVVVLPRGQRNRARQAAVLLGLSLACELAEGLFKQKGSIRRFLLFVETFSLLASIGRSVVLLLVDGLVRRRRSRAV